MYLAEAPKGEALIVVRVDADAKTRRHLENLGIMSGAALELSNFSDGNIIVRIHDCRIALDRLTAANITVRKSPLSAR